MNKKISVGLALFFAIVTATATFALTMSFAKNMFNDMIAGLSERKVINETVDEIGQLIREHYYGKIDETTLNEHIASGYVEGLDDEGSVYMTAEEYAQYQLRLAGKLPGIGITAAYDSAAQALRVTGVLPGSPALNAGLAQGDLITAIDGKKVNEKNAGQLFGELEGRKLTSVDVTYTRGDKRNTVQVTRGYSAGTVTYQMLDGATGYIKILAFYENTAKQLKEAVEDLEKQGAATLVIDVRSAESGSIDSAVAALDVFVPAATGGIPAAKAVDAGGKDIATFVTDSDETALPIALLVNGNTAGGAELFAADLRDFGKAYLIGVDTAGSGKLQQTFELRDGGAVRLSVGLIITYSGGSFDSTGLRPDTVAASSQDPALTPVGEDEQVQAAIEYFSRGS